MTPRTRTSNKDANYKVYYSKKIPQQIHFPHRRKTVRRPDPVEQDGADTRQMKFLPEKMRQQRVQRQERDTDEETEEEGTEQEVATKKHERSTPGNKKGKKRKSNDVQGESATEDEPVVSASKRRRRTTAPKDEPSRTLRRQSTMTQLADGRRPSSGEDEPDFKPVRRRSRTSWGGTIAEGESDKKQRTLTQMIPGMGRLSKEELEELSDLDADLEDTQAGSDAVSRSLIEQGLIEIDEPAATTKPVQQSDEAVEDICTNQEQDEEGSSVAAPTQPLSFLNSVEAAAHDDEDDYQPTQFIEAPTFRTRQTPRRLATRQPSSNAPGPEKSSKPRFSLLSTPEKRQVFEIPSSQSPAESVLSTQISPQKSNRSALRECDSNVTVIAETPSKRRQVTFREPTAQLTPPAHLRKFESTIQDSEDEGSEFDDGIATQQPSANTGETFCGQDIGEDTQAVLLRIDRACADPDGDFEDDSRDASVEPEEPLARSQPHPPSPELGESWAPVIYDDDGPQFESYRSSRASAKSQSFRAADSSKESLPILEQGYGISQLDLTTQVPVPADDIPSTPPMIQAEVEEEFSSTPMIIRDESSDEEEAEPEPTLPPTVQRRVPEPPSTLVHQSTDLDGEPVQVPRSPSADRETQQSHSSKAEQQLQNEWLSYSQYVHAPNSSSMHATADAFSYNATPRLPRTGALPASSARIQHSQATTVDEVTPRKNRTQRVFSANTTPHRTSRTLPFRSPEKPPTPFIPSSFPSPSRTAMEGWSSPVLARTQNVYGSSQVLGSLEDFSIPLPPPVEDD
jgi:hypothetical protein